MRTLTRIAALAVTLLSSVELGQSFVPVGTVRQPLGAAVLGEAKQQLGRQSVACLAKRDGAQEGVSPINGIKRAAMYFTPLIAVLGLSVGDAQAFDAKGEKLFETNCVGCHVGGGNIIG
jgi:mono/diheme cytochrome c family protein